MAELKTKENDGSVDAFIATVDHPVRRNDSITLRAMMEEISGKPARMWGKNIVGFGHYAYQYASGHSGEWARTGFSPRKASMSVYIMPGFDRSQDLLKGLGKHKVGKSCLYIKSLEDVEMAVLRELIARSLVHMTEKYG